MTVIKSAAGKSAAERAPLQEAIAFVDLRAQQARIRADIEARLAAVLDHGRYVDGPEIAELEAMLCERTGAAAAVCVSSGTDSLIIPMLGEGVGPGDAVYIPGFTYNATANAVLLTGATPVLVDVSADDYNLDPAHLRACIEATTAEGALRPRAVIPVDLFGAPADYPAIAAISEEFDLFMLSDAAQSFGGGLDNRAVGALAPATSTSFFPAKSLGCYGDGGAIFSMDEERAEIWRSIRWHGTDDRRQESIRVGMNGRLDTMQAAVLLAKLSIFDDEYEARGRIASTYVKRLAPYADLPRLRQGARSGHSVFSLTVDDRDAVRERLNQLGVPTAVYYRKPLHRMAAFEAFAPEGGLPVCDRLSERILSLPVHPYLSDSQIDRICEAFAEAAGPR